MKSAYAVTFVNYDAQLAAHELASQIEERLQLQSNSCALLFAEVIFDINELISSLEDALGIAVIGCTSCAILSNNGYQRGAASLLVMTGDDCVYGTSLSGPLHDESYPVIKKAYDEALAQLNGEEPKLIFAFTPPGKTMLDDDVPILLNKLSKSCPVVGGVCSDYNTFEKSMVFLGNRQSKDSMLLLLISGNIQPKFAVSKLIPSRFGNSKVTKSCNNELLEIDGLPALDFLHNNGVDIENPFNFSFNPVNIKFSNSPDYDEESIARVIFGIDKDRQSIILKTSVQEGSTISICPCGRKDIEATTRDTLEVVRGEYLMGDDSYKYSTVIGVSCAARHIVMAYEYTREGELVKQIIPSDLNFVGCYSYGEFCPTSMSKGKANNALHHISFTACMF